MEFSATAQSEEETAMDVKRGPWTVEEDLLLMNYVNAHGEGRWNSLAHFAGLRRTGKSCRLRWLNYLRPDVRRGNITPEEQLLILELHSRWGNRWSKIAQHLPGRTDNEIKNYWRTRVQKHAKQLKCDVNSKRFKDAVRYVWMPRLAERIRAAAAGGGGGGGLDASAPAASHGGPPEEKPGSENSSATDSPSWDSAGMQFSPPLAASDGFSAPGGEDSRGDVTQLSELEDFWWEETFPSLDGYADLGFLDLDQNMWTENHWSAQDPWPLQQQF